MRFILDALGVGSDAAFNGVPVPTPGKAVLRSFSGVDIPFEFEDVSSSVEAKAAVFENAAGNGTYVQPNGHTGGRLPMEAIFHGVGYLDRAEAFVGALLEPGPGLLTHPSYTRPIDVVPVGEIGIIDRFVSATNQRIITVQFYETTGLLMGEDSGREQLFDSLMDASSVDFSEKVQLSDAVDKQRFINKVLDTVKTVENTMKKISKGIAGATGLIEGAGDSINRGIDLVIGDPLTMGRQIQIMCGEPRRQVTSVKAKLDGYKGLARSIFGLNNAEHSQYSVDSINEFHLNKLVAQSMLANSAMLAADGSGEYQTRADYLSAADALREFLDDYQEWSDSNYANIEISSVTVAATDTGGGMADLYGLVAASIAELIGRSFSAKNQISMILDGERTPLDLCYELYGTTAPDTMNLFLLSNAIVGDELFLIGKGREIVWYV